VRSVIGNIEKERLDGRRAQFEELDRSLGDERGQILTVHRDPRLVFPEILGPGPAIVMPVVHVAAHQAEEMVEAMRAWTAVFRPSGDGAAQMPFADQPGPIAAVLQQLRQRRAADGKPARPLRSKRGLDRAALRISSADERRSSRAAQHAVRIRVSEAHAVSSQTIEYWRFDVFAAVAAKIGVPHIVGHDQNHVGTRRRDGRGTLL
jgi:hypothetical protein